MMWNYNEWWQMGMGYGFHWIFMIAFWGLVIWAVIALVRSAGKGDGESKVSAKAQSPQEILERRFARGELNAGEFKKMMETLARAGNRLGT